jgi:hypothetical protein
MEKAKNLVKYCDSVYKTQRRKTRTVHCGDVPIGTTCCLHLLYTHYYILYYITTLPGDVPIGTAYCLHLLCIHYTYFTTYLHVVHVVA